ncbi:MAG: DUF721 domain-containing protein [Anaeromyxobacter sp.]|nr:DUF721 domain-containing protein [Anaeromyxobacter sp.]MBL0277843.1 DUF721 domain-containing protein [Anaeromyxobacter sp.]
MRGQRRSVASLLAETLARRRDAAPAALAAALAEACGPQLARQVSCRGLTRDGLVLVVATGEDWAQQVRDLAPQLCQKLNERLGRQAALGLDVRVGAKRP